MGPLAYGKSSIGGTARRALVAVIRGAGGGVLLRQNSKPVRAELRWCVQGKRRPKRQKEAAAGEARPQGTRPFTLGL